MKAQIERVQSLLEQPNSKPEEALILLASLATSANPPWPVLHYIGVAYVLKKDLKTALTWLNKSIQSGDDEAITYHLVSLCHYNEGTFNEAEEFEKQALKRKDFYIGWMHLGSIYRAQAKVKDALECYKHAVELEPENTGITHQIAEIYSNNGRINKAIELFESTTSDDDDHIEAYVSIAQLLIQKQEFDKAEAFLNKILEQEPESIAAKILLSDLFRKKGNYDNALEIFEQLLEGNPPGSVRVNYAVCLQELGRFDEAEANYMKALEVFPKMYESLSNYLMCIHYNPKQNKQDIFKAHTLWDQHFAPQKCPKRPVPSVKKKEKKLRIGLLSGGFKRHPVGWMITRGLENLPPQQFEIFCYTTDNGYDQITNRISAVATKWRSVVGYNDKVIARMIREDEIDILIELSGHAAGNRLRTIAREPAPVIVKWVGGLFNTTGLRSVDFLLSDHYETPKGEEPYYTEKLVRMPEDYICYNPPGYAPDIEPSPPAKKNGYITLGCFNNPSKINEEILARWANIMARLPHCRLLLKSNQYDTEELRTQIITKMNHSGISANRIIFKGQSDHHDHLSWYNQVDIALDPWPYSGGLTTCEALWMGVPVISKPGPTFAGRHSATHLTNAGFPEWVVETWTEYVEKTVTLANNINQLTNLRSSMRKRVADSPLCDAPRFGAHLSVALRKMWKQRVKGYESGDNEWRDHIVVDALSEEHIAEITKQVNVGLMKQSLENEAETVASSDHSSKNKHSKSEFSMKSAQQTEPQSPAVNDLLNADKNNSQVQQDDQKPDVFKVETKNGVTICTPADISLLTPYVLLEQEQWFEPELAFVNEYLEPGMNVIDVGAGFGVYALPMAYSVGSKGKVYAFEPGSLARRHLEMSKLQNHFDHFDISRRAITDQKGRATLQIAQTPELNRLNETGTEEITQTTLDTWWKFENCSDIDFIKLDVNGDEAKVLAGACELLSELSPVLLVAIGEANTDEKKVIIQKLRQSRYELYEYVAPLQLLTAHEPPNSDDYLMNLIAIPQKRVQEFTDNGWIYSPQTEVNAPEKENWKQTLRNQPWAKVLLNEWQQKSDEKGSEYLQALNLLCAAEKIKTSNAGNRSRKATLSLEGVQRLIQIYNGGEIDIPVAMTLARGLNTIGQRNQAVKVLKTLIDSNNFASREIKLERPFLMPLPQQDETKIHINLKNWLTVRIVEAWITLKDVTTYFSGEQALNLLNMLDGNPAVKDQIKKGAYLQRKKNPGAVKNNEQALEFDGDTLNAWFFHKSLTNHPPKENPKQENKNQSNHLRNDALFQTMGNLIKVNGPSKSKKHNLPDELIVSLTSYPQRFSFLPFTLLSLCLQSIHPDRIILWIAEDHKKLLTQEIQAFQKRGVEIKFCEDLKSYKKIIPTLKNYPNSYIVTADDDLYYKKDWLKNLIHGWGENDKNIVAYRVHRIKLNDKGDPEPYHTWNWQYRESTEPSVFNFPTCGAGALFPPHIFHEDVTAIEKFRKLAPNADDIWLYWMTRLNDAKIKVTNAKHPLIEWPSSNNNALWKSNILKGRNDQQIQNMIDAYGFPINEMNRSDTRSNLKRATANNNFSDSKSYWKNRYKKGGNSGYGSYGKLAVFKAEIINSFTKENEVKSLIEFGCGDGNQLKYLTISKYLGFDVSEQALERCRTKHEKDSAKQFKKVENYNGETAECSLSLDVLFHLIEDDVYNDYMHRLFQAAEKFVIIYSSNKKEPSKSPHVKHRLFTKWIEKHASEWKLKKYIPNKYQCNGDGARSSFSDFYIYETS